MKIADTSFKHKKNEFESTFIEIINPKKSNIIVCCIINILQSMLVILTIISQNKLLNKMSKEQKSVFLLGDLTSTY